MRKEKSEHENETVGVLRLRLKNGAIRLTRRRRREEPDSKGELENVRGSENIEEMERLRELVERK